MDCKNYEKQILEVLDNGKLSEQLLSHINKCQNCANFHKHIISLQKGFEEIKKLEPSADFDERIIEKLTAEPSYLKALAFISSFAILISFSIVYLITKNHFTRIVIFFSKILKSCEVLSEIFSYDFYTAVGLFCLGVVFLIVAYGALDVFLLSKLIKNGRKLWKRCSFWFVFY